MTSNPLAPLGINSAADVRKASNETLNACVVKIVDPRCAPTPTYATSLDAIVPAVKQWLDSDPDRWWYRKDAYMKNFDYSWIINGINAPARPRAEALVLAAAEEGGWW